MLTQHPLKDLPIGQALLEGDLDFFINAKILSDDMTHHVYSTLIEKISAAKDKLGCPFTTDLTETELFVMYITLSNKRTRNDLLNFSQRLKKSELMVRHPERTCRYLFRICWRTSLKSSPTTVVQIPYGTSIKIVWERA